MSLWVRTTNIEAQKISSTIIITYKIIVIVFLISNQTNYIKLFTKTFMVANINPKLVFGILFLTLSNVNVNFLEQKLK